MSIYILGLYFFRLADGEKNNTDPTIHPVKLKLTTLNTAAGSMSGPFIINPTVKREVTSTVPVRSAVYSVPAFLFFAAVIPAAIAERKLIAELE